MLKTVSWTLKDYPGQPAGTIVAGMRVSLAITGSPLVEFKTVTPDVLSVQFDFPQDVAYSGRIAAIDPAGNEVPGVFETFEYTLASIIVKGPNGITIS